MRRLLPVIPLLVWMLVGLTTPIDGLVWLALSPVPLAAMMYGVAWSGRGR